MRIWAWMRIEAFVPLEEVEQDLVEIGWPADILGGVAGNGG